jgi:hypothetical protein
MFLHVRIDLRSMARRPAIFTLSALPRRVSCAFRVGYLCIDLGAQCGMVASSFSVVLRSMWLVLSVAEGDVRAVEGF